ncbi:MAG: sigma 54-interacting transcriptional regulator [Polyangiaceae bacterium]
MDHRRDDSLHETTCEIAVTSHTPLWVLEIQDPTGSRRIPLVKRTVLGTSRRADVTVKDPTVSNEHCAFEPVGSRMCIRDLGSKNGTYTGNTRITEALAGLGAVITIGRTTLVLSDGVRDDDADEEDLPAPLSTLAGSSLPMRRLAERVRRLARYSAPVLIAGETGTGKELVARALHDEGPRRDKPFVVINVAALPRELIESELFGHERGSFTGALNDRAGAFAEADGGTLFLDEIGELPLDAQPKLLRALDGYEVRRVGSRGSGKRADVRVIAASHVPLARRVEANRFRRDLFHRLECFVVSIPPLRDRRGDVGAIARRMLEHQAHEIGPRTLSSGALARLAAYDWPGNVRELRNILLRAADHADDDGIIDARAVQSALTRDDGPTPLDLTPPLARALMAEHENNMSAAARAAGLARTTFRKLLLASGE